jgi:hypothetical protein
VSREVKLVVKAVRRKEPDDRQLARALIELARLEDETTRPAEAPEAKEKAS